MNQKENVLIVDDDPDIVKILVLGFKSKGFEVETLKSGNEALDWIRNGKSASLIVLDRILPDMDGMEVLKELGKKSNKTPVLILSVLDTEQDMFSGLSEGASEYIVKPFQLKELLDKAMALMGKT